MFLKSLQLQGFKSFPDKVRLDFRQGITATVGPNGSGKSNVSDAVRWVFGEQAPSALRVKNMEEIIFNGTNKRKAAGFAEVIITIDNSQRWLACDSDEVSIGRRFYRNGSSEYKLNGKLVLLRDITDLLMDTGIGRNGYSMIGQGKISDIVETKATDRRMIFEEAAGISKYRHSKEETERNLKKAEDNLVHLEVKLSDLEARVGPLERESEKARQWLELRDQQKTAQIGLWLLMLENSNDILRDQAYEITRLTNEYNELTDNSEKLDAEAEAIYAESTRLLAEKDTQIREAGAMEEQATRLEGDAAVTDAEIQHARQDAARIEAEIADSANSESQLRAEIEQKEKELEQRRSSAAEQEKVIADAAALIEALRTDECGFGSELEKLRVQQNSLTVEQSKHQLDAARAESQLAEIDARASSLDSAAQERSQRQSALEKDRDETAEALELAKEKASEAGNAVAGYRMRLDKQRAKMDEMKKTADSLRLDSDDKARRAKVIEDLERSMDGFQRSVREVIKHAESGRLNGIHGTVSRVITVKPEYSVAVETALGGAMQNIIVDSENDGKQAMEFLKRNSAGRATFLPISVIKPRELHDTDGLDECAGFVSIASGLVGCDAKYRSIIENLLGNVCVVEDMDSAIAIARRYKNRFRIVTMDGQVINAGGSMTGGSNDKNIGLLSRKGELEKYRAESAELSKKAAAAMQEYEQLRQKAAADEAQLLASQSELACAQEDRAKFETALRMLEEQCAANAEEIKNIESERQGNTGRKTQLAGEKAAASAKAAEVAEKLSALAEEIAERTGSIDRLAADRETLSEKLNSAGMERLSMLKEAESIAGAIETLRDRIAQGSGREQQLREQIAALEQSVAELEAKAAEQRSQAQQLRAEAKEKGNVAAIEQRRDEMERQISEKRRESRELMDRRAAVDREKARLEEKHIQKQQETDTIIQSMMEEYDITRHDAELQFEPAENEREAKRTVASLTSKIRALGSVYVGAIEEFKEVNAEYTMYKTQIGDVIKSKTEMEKLIAELTDTMKTIFRDAFASINRNFSEIFPELFGGGSAKMTLTDEDDCLNCGIDIEITPPGKSRQSINLMSGGEKAIIALAIYFAIMRVRPSPFCFLDEVDAPLDEHNVVNIAHYIQRFTDTTQYIVITHRRGMMESASMLYGVTMQEDGESKVLSLALDDIEDPVWQS